MVGIIDKKSYMLSLKIGQHHQTIKYIISLS